MASDYETIEITRNSRGCCTVALNRPSVHNAFNEVMIEEMTDVLKRFSIDDAARCIIVKGNGRSFCAGADLDWMRRTARYGEVENLEDAKRLGTMLDLLYRLPVPTVAQVHGSVFGGGVGLVACCDIAVASSDSVFSLSEVKLGLIPSVISPYVVQAIGPRAARRYFLTGERFLGQTAKELGLVHELCSPDSLPEQCHEFVEALQSGGPMAQREAKLLIQTVVADDIDSETIEETPKRIARVRASAEAQEGMSAFFEKRAPQWTHSESS